jgi:hypothetical protein
MKTALNFRLDESFNFKNIIIFHQKFEDFQKYHFLNVENYDQKIILKNSQYAYNSCGDYQD